MLSVFSRSQSCDRKQREENRREEKRRENEDQAKQIDHCISFPTVSVCEIRHYWNTRHIYNKISTVITAATFTTDTCIPLSYIPVEGSPLSRDRVLKEKPNLVFLMLLLPFSYVFFIALIISIYMTSLSSFSVTTCFTCRSATETLYKIHPRLCLLKSISACYTQYFIANMGL